MWVLAWSTIAFGQETGLLLDRDEDGWTVGEGDCDDENEDVNPGRVEVCFDDLDNDCNGFVDELCDDSARLGSLSGGGACTGGSNIAGTTAMLMLPGLGLLRRRRSAR